MFGIGIPEIIAIVVVFGILFFGSKKMVEFARSFGRLSGEFKKGKADVERELRDSETAALEKKDVSAGVTAVPATPTASTNPEVK